MSTLSEEKVLRINCPGFGTTSTLPLGEAKPLAMYDVIVINPTSVLHMFDEKSDVLKQIDTLQADGMTSYRAEDDTLLESITAELDLRTQELTQFLKKGGLLIFYLTPPFSMHGPSVTIDNFSWLGEWAPDKPQGPNQRNMSATIRGKAIDMAPDSGNSVWTAYLKQPNLEWSTIIRSENLTEGYVTLAFAGPNKVIAAFKASGPKGGMVVFLPAPYNAELDDKLRECIERWYAFHNDEAEPTTTPLTNLSNSLSSLLSDEPLRPEPPKKPEKSIPPLPANIAASVPATPAPAPTPAAPAPTPEPAPIATPPPVEVAQTERPEFFDFKNNDGKGQQPPPAPVEEPQEAPEAKDLIRKMEQEISKPQVPDWCVKYSFNELDGLRQQLTDLQEEMRLAQLKAADLQGRIEVMDDLKNALLASTGEHLTAACTKVFETVGWHVKPAIGSADELWLMDEDKTQAIVRLVFTTEQPNRAELAALAESVITYWGAHEVEPKGILVTSTWADKPPSDRKDEDYSETMNEFAKRKNLCLLTTTQLLSIYRDLTVNNLPTKQVKETILTTSGRVPGFVLDSAGAKGKTAASRF